MSQPEQSKTAQAGLLMLGAMAIIGGIDNVIALMAEVIGLWQFHFTRALVAAPLVVLAAWLGFGTLRPKRLWAVALRSVLVGLSMLFYFGALGLLPIAQALAGLFTSPIFVLLISALVFGERIGPWRSLAVACGFAGILLVLQLDPETLSWRSLLPVAGGVFYAMGAIVTRRYCAEESTVAVLAGMWLTLAVMGAAGLAALSLWPATPAPGADGFLLRGWVWPMTGALGYVVLQAVGSVIAVFLIIRAYQVGEPSRVAIYEYSVMIFGPLYALVLFGQTLAPLQILGVGLIILAGAIIALRARGEDP